MKNYETREASDETAEGDYQAKKIEFGKLVGGGADEGKVAAGASAYGPDERDCFAGIEKAA